MLRAVGARRTPALVATFAILAVFQVRSPAAAQATEDLRSALGRALGTGWRGASWGIAVVSLDAGDTLFALAPEAPLAPASNLKLLTTAAALELLGPEYRFRTYLLTDGLVDDGVVRGNLILYGTGDPGISDRFFRRKDEVFHRFIDELERLGVHTVEGDVVGDASYFEGPLRPEGWNARDLNDHFAAAVSALSFNENVVSFRVVARTPGEPPTVHTIPDHSGLEIENRARTVERGAQGRVHIVRDDPLAPVRVEGQIASGSRDVWREMTVPVPAHFAASVFRAKLEERGIRVEGDVRVVDDAERSALLGLSAPALGRRGVRVLARHVSVPLSSYLEVVNKESNNLFAELVFRTLGRTGEGRGAAEASERAVQGALQRLGVDMSQVVQLDGSGLSRGSRVSAFTFVSLLERLAASRHWDSFWASLPEAGRRGGLARMYNTAAAGNLRAKTGTIEGVSALSGVVRSRDGERLAFSLLVNGTASTTRAKRVENEIGALLASFRRPAPQVPADLLASADEALASGAVGRHRISTGEDLSGIASRYGLSVDDLMRANPFLEPGRITAGEWLEIPTRAGSE